MIKYRIKEVKHEDGISDFFPQFFDSNGFGGGPRRDSEGYYWFGDNEKISFKYIESAKDFIEMEKHRYSKILSTVIHEID